MSKSEKAMVVLSGGQDSTTCLFWAMKEYGEVHAISFNYGQRHAIELESAVTVAKMAGVASHEIVDVRGLLRSRSPLTSDTELEQYENAQQMAEVIGNRVELTFVPMRNTFFLTVAANYALARDCYDLVTGICQEDNANYPDCTEQFRRQMEETINESLGFSQKRRDRLVEEHATNMRYASIPISFKIRAPLMHRSKAETCTLAHQLGPECWKALAFSHTSYDGKYPPTDMNHANVLRAEGFARARLADPLVLRAWREGLMELPASSNYDKYRQGVEP